MLLPDGHTARFTPAANYAGLAGFNFAVAGNDGTAMTNAMGLVVTPLATVPSPVWSGAVNGNWDNGTANWTWNAAPKAYADGEAVQFDDTAAGTTTVNLTTAVSPAAVTVSNSALNYTFTGPGKITSATALTKKGAGTLTLLTTNDYSGGTTISNGTLQVGNGGTTGSLGTGSLTNYGTLAFNRSDAINFATIINGSGNLVQSGSGTLMLTSANTYTGTTTVSNGTLLVNGSLTGGGAVTVMNGMLAGTGSITGPVTVQSGAALSPGIGSGYIGNLTVNGPVTLNGGGTLVTKVINANGAAGTDWDLLAVTGGINLQATSASKFTLKLLSLNGSGAAGAVANFDKDRSYSWTVASTTGSVTNFNASKFSVDTSSFSNDLAGGYFFAESGSLKVSFTNNHAPVAGTATYVRPAGLTYKIAVANLLANWTSDLDNDPRTLVGFDATSTNGVNVTSDGVYLYYHGTGSVADSFGYTIRDVRTNAPAVYRAGDTVRTAVGTVIARSGTAFDQRDAQHYRAS